MHIDLRAGAEDDAVGIDDQHRAVGLDLAEDAARRAGRVDAVERHPARIALLIVDDGRVGRDIVIEPGHHRLRGGLLDGDSRLAVTGRSASADFALIQRLGVVATRGSTTRPGSLPSPPIAEAVGDRRIGRAGRRRARRGLSRLHRLDRLRRAQQRALALLGDGRRLLRGRRRRVDRDWLGAGAPFRPGRSAAPPRRHIPGRPSASER